MANKYVKSFNFSGDTLYPLPIVTIAENGMVLKVVDGEWDIGEIHRATTVLYPETTINGFYATSDYYEAVPFDSALYNVLTSDETPAECVVYFDGVKYTAKRYTSDIPAIGNLSILDSSAEDTGEPFLIRSFVNVDTMSVGARISTTIEGSSHTIKIVG